MRKHIVMYRFGDDVPQEPIDEIFSLLADAKRQISGMLDFSHGQRAGDIEKSKGFTHCFVMDFEDVAALDEYLRHSNHLQVRINVRKLVASEDDIFELDYDYNQ
jgi:hypothetical protein